MKRCQKDTVLFCEKEIKMFELTIDGNVYSFHFGMGFLREINRTVSGRVDGLENEKKNIGLQYKVGGLIDGDVEDLVEILDIANKKQNPRVTRELLDAYIDDEKTDIDALFDEVLGFLRKSNATRRTVEELMKAVEEEKKKQGMNN